MDEEKIEELLGAMLALSGAGMAMERALHALMASHPDPAALHQALFSELHPSKMPSTHPEPLQNGWQETARAFLEHSTLLVSAAQSGQAGKN